jgi:hypothetical protein
VAEQQPERKSPLKNAQNYVVNDDGIAQRIGRWWWGDPKS